MLAAQAKVPFYALLILILTIIGTGIKMGVENASLVSWGAFIGSTIFTGLILAMYLYDVNCVVVGECMFWGWVKSVFLTLIIAIYIIVMIIALFKKSTQSSTLEVSNTTQPVVTNTATPTTQPAVTNTTTPTTQPTVTNTTTPVTQPAVTDTTTQPAVTATTQATTSS